MNLLVQLREAERQKNVMKHSFKAAETFARAALKRAADAEARAKAETAARVEAEAAAADAAAREQAAHTLATETVRKARDTTALLSSALGITQQQQQPSTPPHLPQQLPPSPRPLSPRLEDVDAGSLQWGAISRGR